MSYESSINMLVLDMRVKFLDLRANYETVRTEVHDAMAGVLDRNDYILGKEVVEFEENFARFCGVKHCIGVANGTDALSIALSSLELGDDAEVIVPGNTYVATCLGAVHNNHKLVLCDCDSDTYQISLDDLRRKITEKTRAIIVVHLYGMMSNMDDVCDICRDNNIVLLEDAAQAHGAEWKGKKAGSFGKISCFSFYPGKNLGAYGDGGAICTDDEELDNKIRMIRNNGSVVKYKHDVIGRNSRLDTIQAAVLDVKLKRLPDNNEARRCLAKLYDQHLPVEVKRTRVIHGCTPVYHLYVIRTAYRDQLQDYLKEKGVDTLIHYPIPCSELRALTPYCDCSPQNCANLSKEILSLPMYPELEEDKCMYVCELARQFFVSKSQLLKLEAHETKNKGGVLNCLNSMDFNTKRVFYIDRFNKGQGSRGNHANRTCNELLIVTKGSIKVKLTPRSGEAELHYLSKNDAVPVPYMVWLEFWSMDDDSSICVLCDEEFETDGRKSIFDFDEFVQDVCKANTV
ncbi:MAG: aminotransferase class V-fold PLP-dependent enzyme [Candidatus Thorarchaeota archaeon]